MHALEEALVTFANSSDPNETEIWRNGQTVNLKSYTVNNLFAAFHHCILRLVMQEWVGDYKNIVHILEQTAQLFPSFI